MTSRLILVLGNIASMVLTIVAFLQLLSWTITGVLILATLTLSTLAPARGRDRGEARSPSRKSIVHAATVDTEQRAVEKPVPHFPPGPAGIESKPTPRHEPARPIAPQPRPEPERTVPASPSRPGSARQESFKTVPPKIVPPGIVPSTFSPSKPVPVKPGMSRQELSRPITPKVNPTGKQLLARSDSGGGHMIGRGDYEPHDVELEEGGEVTCKVAASGRVNVYLLDEDNLNSLDSGEEFWSETGEEDVESAALSFTAPEKGKWFLVVENVDSKEVSATLKIEKYASKTGQAVGSSAERMTNRGQS